MDMSIHFSEVLGLLTVLAGAGAWVWTLGRIIQRHHLERRARLYQHQLHRI
jgi:hypothetical protein